MSKLAPLHWQVIDRLLLKEGYRFDRCKGSHRVYIKPGRLMHVTLPMDRQLPVGTQKAIMRQMGIELERYLTELEKIRH